LTFEKISAILINENLHKSFLGNFNENWENFDCQKCDAQGVFSLFSEFGTTVLNSAILTEICQVIGNSLSSLEFDDAFILVLLNRH